MELRQLSTDDHQALERLLGYLNFSSGAEDTQFLAAMNRAFALVGGDAADPEKKPVEPEWRRVVRLLLEKLGELRGQSGAFRDPVQAESVLRILEAHVVPGYLEFHRDLLWGRREDDLCRPFFLGRVCEAILRAGGPWDEPERIRQTAIRVLNDYIGHRPVATLESQKMKPYDHEWLRPVPWYIRGAGVAVGRYAPVIEKTLELLEATDDRILHEACFDPRLLDELAVDPRPYDFDHPVNKRPNYHFGQWDPHHLDAQGRYRRFVVQEVTLNALTQRLHEDLPIPYDELLFEAAAVLAGTILMAAGVSGRGPGTYDSSVSLSILLPKIARYRDEFYERLLQRVGETHGLRLRAEAAERKQPFGGSRQHLNAQLARRRASQVEHVHLAWIFARMGFPDAAGAHVEAVAVPSARMQCQIECWLTAGWRAIEARDLEQAADLPAKILALLHRAIECGAVVDPWNILGFDGHFSLFPAMENSIHDHRVDELVELVEEIMAYFARVWSEAAAQDRSDICQRISSEFERFSTWWRRFAAHEVESIKAADPAEEYRAAEHVAQALNLWYKGGAAAGKVAFWAPHADLFNSPKAYTLVTESLLDRGDLVAPMSLLMHWLNQARRIPLEHGEDSFFRLVERWLSTAVRGAAPEANSPAPATTGATATDPAAPATPTPDRWNLVRKLFDYLEANADEFWRVPRFELHERRPGKADRPAAARKEEDEDEEDDDLNLFGAAYEDVVYIDSTDDGVEGETLDTGGVTHDELEQEGQRITDRLAFLTCLARLWRTAALTQTVPRGGTPADLCCPERRAVFLHWIDQAQANQQGLLDLLDAVKAHRIAASSGDHEAMIEYDRKRIAKEALLEQVIATSVETADAIRVLRSLLHAGQTEEIPPAEEQQDESLAVALSGALIRGDLDRAQKYLSSYLEVLGQHPLLYVPLAKGGQPRAIVAARTRQRSIQDLLSWLPRRGLLIETCQLMETAREMERRNPVGPGAVTEFDELFKIGYDALVEHLILSALSWDLATDESDEEHNELVGCVERLTETMLLSWLAHSRTLRLSVLEKVQDKQSWSNLISFIEQYGQDLFTQRFLNLGNLRAILHQGVEGWLTRLLEDPRDDIRFRLLDDLEAKKVETPEAVERLSLVLEAVVENYGEYRDYNSTTTQSDHGEMLYTLLDFLRLRVRYDRICWNLKPVVWAHEIMVRQGLFDAAALWRRALADRVGDEAEQFVKKLQTLQKKYAMQMPSIADRIAERFLRPLQIDRMRAMVEPAMRIPRDPKSVETFEQLRREAETLAKEPSGSGLDTPAWLVSLEEEVERVRRHSPDRYDHRLAATVIERRLLTLEEIDRQIEAWSAREQ